MHDAEKNDSQYLEDELGSFAFDATQDLALARAVVSLNGWAGGRQVPIHQIALEYGLPTVDVNSAMDSLSRFCKGKPAPILEEVIQTISGWLPCAVPTVGHWLAENDLVRSSGFTISGIIEAADVFAIELPFKAVSREYTKWLVDPKEDCEPDMNVGDEIARKALAQSTHIGIVDPLQFSSLDKSLNSAEDQTWFWESIEACPHLFALNRRFIICKEPRKDAEIVKRLNRLLSLVGAVRLPIALRQVTRDGGHNVLPIIDVDILEAFVTHCSYYTFDDGDIVSARSLIVDEEVSRLEYPVIMALMDSPAAATIEDLELTIRKSPISSANIGHVLETSPLIVNMAADRYALFDASMFETVGSNTTSENLPESIVDAPSENEASVSIELLDLAKLGATEDSWWAMYAGPISMEQMEGAKQAEQSHLAILDPDTDKCVGLVLTSRVINKYYNGNPSVLLNDKGLKGMELPRFVRPDELRSAFSDTHLIFYNDSANDGQDGWGVVFRRDVSWV